MNRLKLRILQLERDIRIGYLREIGELHSDNSNSETSSDETISNSEFFFDPLTGNEFFFIFKLIYVPYHKFSFFWYQAVDKSEFLVLAHGKNV